MSRWQMFIGSEKIDYREKQSFVTEHVAGVCHSKDVGNIMFVGNAAGLMDSLVGFGIYNAVISGPGAAESICRGASYTHKISSPIDRMYCAYVDRPALN